mmetsp:Transcript_19236/g.34022  ORF Transcript_19236/g.34022 Transcript_19236/m.34022 type:complete len:123 (+) Transcript_19236:112-480(+)
MPLHTASIYSVRTDALLSFSNLTVWRQVPGQCTTTDIQNAQSCMIIGPLLSLPISGSMSWFGQGTFSTFARHGMQGLDTVTLHHSGKPYYQPRSPSTPHIRYCTLRSLTLSIFTPQATCQAN